MTSSTKRASIAQLIESRSGSIMVPFGLAATLIFGSVGGAIDFNRWHTAKRVTAEAMDAAVLAGARSLQIRPGNTQAAIDTATAYFQRNMNGKVDLAVNSIAFVVADQNQAMTATGDAKINATFLKVLGISQLTVLSDVGSAFPKAKLVFGSQGGSNIEISLMLDVTGSMCANGVGPCTSSPKLTGLKTAAKDLVDFVVAENQTTYFSKMAIVPFSTRVRVGPDGGGGSMMSTLTNLNSTWSGWYNECIQSTGGGGSEGGGNWQCLQYQPTYKTNWKIMPCVTDRFYNSNNAFDYTDNDPGGNRWLNAHDGGRMPRSWDSSNANPGNRQGEDVSDPADHWNYNWNGSCADVAQANEIMPLSTDKTALKAKIDGLEAYGSTAGALGTAWSWYMLSPRWNGVWTGASSPGNYSDLTNIQANGKPVLRKVAILMTDGVYNTFRGWKDQNQQMVSNAAKQMCTNMKAEGIEIFTVGLALNELSSAERSIAEDTLQSCGTDLSHFYSTINVQELQVAFQDIAYQLSGIALTR